LFPCFLLRSKLSFFFGERSSSSTFGKNIYVRYPTVPRDQEKNQAHHLTSTREDACCALQRHWFHLRSFHFDFRSDFFPARSSARWRNPLFRICRHGGVRAAILCCHGISHRSNRRTDLQSGGEVDWRNRS